MSRRADCYDNAPMESFFHTPKTELVHHRHYQTCAEAQRDIFAFIEGFYNRTRLHSAIGYIAPIENGAKSRLNPSTFSGEDQCRGVAFLKKIWAGGHGAAQIATLRAKGVTEPQRACAKLLRILKRVDAHGQHQSPSAEAKASAVGGLCSPGSE